MRPLIAVSALVLLPTTVIAQRSPLDTLRLAPLHAAMERTDRRSAQRPLVAEQSRLRQRTLGTEALPSVSALATGQYVSDVPAVGGVAMVPYQQYDAYLSVRQRLFDPTRSTRRALETAQLDETDARLRGAVWQQRQAVNDAFFTLAALDAETRTLRAAMTDLDAQLRQLEARRAAGAATAGDVALLRAEWLRRAQTLDALTTDRAATAAVLASLTGQAIASDAPVALPFADDRGDSVATEQLRARPEYAQFDGARAIIAERERLASRADLPRLVAFARLGYGRPGINPLARDFDQYWIGGLQLEWTPAAWGGAAREREVQRLQRELVAQDEAQFTAQLTRSLQRDLAGVERYARTLAADSEIIALHEQALAEARRRFAEGSITAAELVDRETDLLAARTAQELHRVRLAEARARVLTSLGQEIR